MKVEGAQGPRGKLPEKKHYFFLGSLKTRSKKNSGLTIFFSDPLFFFSEPYFFLARTGGPGGGMGPHWGPKWVH